MRKNKQKVVSSDSKTFDSRSFGERLRFLREKLGLTQEQVAQKAGINQTFLTHLEKNRKMGSVATMFNLAKALEINPAYKIFAFADPDGLTVDLELQKVLYLPANLTEEDQAKVYNFICQLSLERHKQLLEQNYPIASALKSKTLVDLPIEDKLLSTSLS